MQYSHLQRTLLVLWHFKGEVRAKVKVLNANSDCVVSLSCNLPFLRYLQFESRNGSAAATWPRPWHTPKTPCDVLEMSWTRARSLLVCILHKFFAFFLSKEEKSSRFPSLSSVVEEAAFSAVPISDYLPYGKRSPRRMKWRGSTGAWKRCVHGCRCGCYLSFKESFSRPPTRRINNVGRCTCCCCPNMSSKLDSICWEEEKNVFVTFEKTMDDELSAPLAYLVACCAYISTKCIDEATSFCHLSLWQSKRVQMFFLGILQDSQNTIH